jgi:hypothetical protein
MYVMDLFRDYPPMSGIFNNTSSCNLKEISRCTSFNGQFQNTI